ncbi:hypothetical protein HY375_03810 [Candidatus Berkelbacteria bacterium]|nr:hypothetical protein [Candidatus Berkelbacteria bacterium]
MDVGTVFAESWEAFRKQFRFLALFALSLFILGSLLALLLTGSALLGLSGLSYADLAAGGGANVLSASLSAAGLAGWGLSSLLLILLAPWLAGAGAAAGILVTQKQKKVLRPWTPYAVAWANYPALFALSIVLGITLWIGYWAFVLPGIILSTLLALSSYVVIGERVTMLEALTTSWNLGIAHFSTILVTGLALVLIGWLIALTAGLVPVVGQYLLVLVSVFASVTLAVVYKHATK